MVDDGSTDATADIVATWQAEADFPIRYVYQENGHKKTALNTGFRHAQGVFTVILDSDDELTPAALAIFDAAWNSVPPEQRDGFSSIRALCIDPAGQVVGDLFPSSPFDASANELLYRYRIGGEKLSCDKTTLLRRFPFPEDVRGLVPEQVLWSQLSAGHRCRCVNEVVRVYHDSSDSLSRRLTSYAYSNDVDGLAFAYSFVLDHDWRWFLASPTILIKVAANRTRFLLHLRQSGSKRRYPLSTAGARMLNLTFGWLGHLLYRRDMIRASRP